MPLDGVTNRSVDTAASSSVTTNTSTTSSKPKAQPEIEAGNLNEGQYTAYGLYLAQQKNRNTGYPENPACFNLDTNVYTNIGKIFTSRSQTSDAVPIKNAIYDAEATIPDNNWIRQTDACIAQVFNGDDVVRKALQDVQLSNVFFLFSDLSQNLSTGLDKKTLISTNLNDIDKAIKIRFPDNKDKGDDLALQARQYIIDAMRWVMGNPVPGKRAKLKDQVIRLLELTKRLGSAKPFDEKLFTATIIKCLDAITIKNDVDYADLKNALIESVGQTSIPIKPIIAWLNWKNENENLSIVVKEKLETSNGTLILIHPLPNDETEQDNPSSTELVASEK